VAAGWALQRKPQISPLRYPGFPVDLDDVGEVHAAFLIESRTRGRFVSPAWQEIRVRYGRDDNFVWEIER
jgi:hypothetical protein